MKNFIREKKIYCGDYLEVDIIPMSESRLQKGKRSKKVKVSAPKQKNINDKNARRYFVQLVNANFGRKDIHLTLTYDDEHMPLTVEEAEKYIQSFLERLRPAMKAIGIELKYVLVTEYVEGDEEKKVRMHHHMIINKGIDRDQLESMWCKTQKGRKKKDYEPEYLGRVNADRLQPDKNGLEALAMYLTKRPNRKKRWSSSRNLKKPTMRTNDTKYSKRKIEKIAKEPPNKDYWERQYPGYMYTEIKVEYNDITGWSIYLKLRKANSKNST